MAAAADSVSVCPAGRSYFLDGPWCFSRCLTVSFTISCSPSKCSQSRASFAWHMVAIPIAGEPKVKVAGAVFMAWYNFCRVHQTFRVMPAMEAGLGHHVWTLQGITDEPRVGVNLLP